MKPGLFYQAKLRMEAIDFQNDDFGAKLEKPITEILALIQKGYTSLEVQKLPQIKEIEDIIFKRMRLTCRINTEQALAAIIPFYFSENAVFLKKHWRNESLLKEQDAVREGKRLTGVVDENNVMLGGIFSEYVHTVYMNFNELDSYEMTAAEITGVLLHELGHGFYSCAYAARFDRANQLISEALRKGKDSGKDKFTEITYKEISGKFKNVSKETVSALTSSNPIILGGAAFKMISEAVLQQQEDGSYDQTSFEMLADNFAARFNYHDPLVTALEKLHPGGVKTDRFLNALNMAATTYQVVMSVMYSILSLQNWLGKEAGSVAEKIFAAIGLIRVIESVVWAALFSFYLIKTSGESGRDYTYDDLVQRYNRIRLQIIEKLKTKDYSKRDAEAMISSAEMIGGLIQGLKPYRGPLDFLFNTFNPKDRRAAASIKRQQAIEQLLANDLFLASAKINLNR